MLLTTTQKIQVVLGAAPTTQLPVVVGWADMAVDASTLAPNALTTATNSTTAVDIVAAPASGLRQLKYLSVYNLNAASVIVTLRIDDAATTRIIATVILPAGYRLEYLQETGLRVLTGTGAVLGLGTAGVGDVAGYSPIRVAVLGDSFSTQNYNMATAWPALLEESLRSSGVAVEVFNCSAAAHSFYRANTTVKFGTLTAVEHAIALAPDIVIVALGYNDLVTKVDARSLTTVQADAVTTFSALKAGLPSAKIIYLGERPYDATNFPTPGTTLKNKGTFGVNFQKKTTGILTGFWTNELLDDSASATTKTDIDNWKTMDAAIRLNANVDVSGMMDIWKLHRMGGGLFDMLHLSGAAHVLMASYAMKSLRDPVFATLLPRILMNSNVVRNDPDSLFSSMFTASTDEWVLTSQADADSVRDALGGTLRPATWYLPRDAKIVSTNYFGTNLNGNDAVYFNRVLTGLKPNTVSGVSVNGAAFSTSPFFTNEHGDMISGSTGGGLLRSLGPGSFTFRYKVDDIVLPPLTFDITDGSSNIVDIATTTYTLTRADGGKFLRFTSASAVTVTIPAFATQDLTLGAEFNMMQYGAGAVTVVGDAGVTLRKNAALGAASGGTYAVFGVKRLPTVNEWVIFGQMA